MLSSMRKHTSTVIVAAVVALITAGGSAAVAAAINATKLNGYKANQLTRTAESHINNNALNGVSGVARQVSINAPKAGYLVMTASSDVYNTGAGDTNNCYLTLDGTTLSSSNRTIQLDTNNFEENCGTDSSWPVAKGSHLVTLSASGVAVSTIYDETTLEVTFVPFNGSGQVPFPVAPSGQDAGGDSGN